MSPDSSRKESSPLSVCQNPFFILFIQTDLLVVSWELVVKGTPYLGGSTIASLSSLSSHSNTHEPLFLGKSFQKKFYLLLLCVDLVYLLQVFNVSASVDRACGL